MSSLLPPNAENAAKVWLKEYIAEHCIVYGSMPGKLLGSKYSWMFYLRRGLFNPTFNKAVATCFAEQLFLRYQSFNFQLAGFETGATPMLASIPIYYNLIGHDINAFSVRKAQKEYGLKNWIEGRTTEAPVVLIDDLCNSSRSLRLCYNKVRELGLPIVPHAFAIVNKVNNEIHDEARRTTDMYLPPSVKVFSIFTLDDFGLFNPSH